MRKSLLCLPVWFALATSVSFAQGPSINSDHFPKAGDKKISYVADTTGITPGQAGENVTWDFTGLKQNAARTKVTTEIKVNAGSLYTDDFPNAAMFSYTASSQSYVYFNTANNSMETVGQVSSVAGTITVQPYVNTLINYTYPMAYNYTHSDDFTAAYSAKGANVDRKGRVNVKADGYGTLKLRDKTFENVLRVYSETWQVDSVLQAGEEVMRLETHTRVYSFISPDQKEDLLTITLSKVMYGGNPLSSTKTVTFNDNGTSTTAIDEPSAQGTAELTVYPNPANGHAWLQFDMKNVSQGSIRVLDMTGKEMLTQAANFIAGRNVQQINTENLPKGMYMVQGQTESGSVATARLVVN